MKTKTCTEVGWGEKNMLATGPGSELLLLIGREEEKESCEDDR